MSRKTPKRKVGRPVDASLQQRRQEEILDVATHIFAAQGYRNADTQEIADELGVGKGTLYRYFPSKQKLFLAVVDRGMRRLKEKVDAVSAAVVDPFERMKLAIEAYLQYFEDHPEMAELFIQERAEFRDRKKSTYFAYREAGQEEWHGVLRDLISKGRLRKIPVDRIDDAISDLLYGTMFTNYFAGTKKSAVEQAEDIVDVIFFGILSDRERKRS